MFSPQLTAEPYLPTRPVSDFDQQDHDLPRLVCPRSISRAE